MLTLTNKKNKQRKPIEYHMDEKELKRKLKEETEWVRVKNRKRKKLNTTPSPQNIS